MVNNTPVGVCLEIKVVRDQDIELEATPMKNVISQRKKGVQCML